MSNCFVVFSPRFRHPVFVAFARQQAVEGAAFVGLAFRPDAASSQSVVIVTFDDVFAENETESGAVGGRGVGGGLYFLVCTEKVF